MSIDIFVGPSISSNEIKNISDEFLIHPPAKQGDIYKLLNQKNRVKKIGIVDGYFESVPSVMHKEIMYAIGQGVKVYGSSSMGALRAAELKDYGMIGVGYVYNLYASNFINDDDEVAVAHAPETMNYVSFSIPMVSMRYNLEKAVQKGIVTISFMHEFISQAKNVFYKKRSYEIILQKMLNPCLNEQKKEFVDWIKNNGMDIKKIDAKVLLREILSKEKHQTQSNLNFIFQNTKIWQNTLQIVEK